MRQFIFTLIALVYLTVDAVGQNKTYLGFEFAVAHDIYKITDNGGYLKPIPLPNAQWGFNVRQEMKRNLFIETGFIVKYYQQGFGFKPIPYNASSSSDCSWLIPLRLGMKVKLFSYKIHFVPMIGYTFGINPPYGEGFGYGTQTSGSIVIKYNYSENPNVARYFSLLQTGLGFEIELFRTMLFSISGNYYMGFNTTTQLDIRYTVNNSDPMTGTAVSKGQFWCINAGLKYPISNFWEKD